MWYLSMRVSVTSGLEETENHEASGAGEGVRGRAPPGYTLGIPATRGRLVVGGGEEGRQGGGGWVCRMPQIGQAKGGFNRLQQGKVRMGPRILHASHPIVRNGDEHDPIVEVVRIVALGGRQQGAGHDDQL